MLTRILLLVLAMVTGLSAAQAAGAARPVADRPEVSRPLVQNTQERVALRAAQALFAPAHSGFRVADSIAATGSQDADRVPPACIYRSDRRRE